MNRIAFGLLFTLFLGAAFSGPPTASASPAIDVAEVVGEQGEQLEELMLRIAPMLDRYTAETGFEACGMVAQSADGQRYGVRLVSAKGSMHCSMSRSNVPDGMRALNVSIHSHPHNRSVFPTSADVTFYLENPMVSGRIVKRGKPERVGGAYFSGGDYASGPGYLVAEGQLLYQEGRGNERNLGHFDVAPGLVAQTN